MSFTSSRNIGLLKSDGSETKTEAAARKNHHGVSFTSARNIGLFPALGGRETIGEGLTYNEIRQKYTLTSDADEEEDKAVTAATLGTFFATWFVAMAFGCLFGICCCVRKCGLLADKSGSQNPKVSVELRDDAATPQLTA